MSGAGRSICMGCWTGRSSRQKNGDGEDCDNCGLPGPKPADYEAPVGSGRWVTFYINHGNTWQSMDAPARDLP